MPFKKYVMGLASKMKNVGEKTTFSSSQTSQPSTTSLYQQQNSQQMGQQNNQQQNNQQHHFGNQVSHKQSMQPQQYQQYSNVGQNQSQGQGQQHYGQEQQNQQYGKPMQNPQQYVSAGQQNNQYGHGQQPYGHGQQTYGQEPFHSNQQYGTMNQQYGQQYVQTMQQQNQLPSQHHQPQNDNLHQFGKGPAPMMNNSPIGNNMGLLQQKLQQIISENKLEAFYSDPMKFQNVLNKVQSVNFDEISARWRIPKELAYDLAPLSLYDIVFYCDDSGSMVFEEGGSRVDDLKFILSKTADIATMFDEDGVLVRFMNSNVNGDGIRSAHEVENLMMSPFKFGGTTPLGTNLDKKILQPIVIGQANSSNMAKPILVIAVTDGEPSESRDTLRQVIRRTKESLSRTRYGAGAFAMQIAQVGKDARAQKFLAEIDNDPVVGSMVDCTSYFEMEAEECSRKGVELTPEMWLLKMCVGAIDKSYDAHDD